MCTCTRNNSTSEGHLDQGGSRIKQDVHFHQDAPLCATLEEEDMMESIELTYRMCMDGMTRMNRAGII